MCSIVDSIPVARQAVAASPAPGPAAPATCRRAPGRTHDAVPPGVPVTTTVPGRSVKFAEKKWISYDAQPYHVPR